MSNLVQPLWRVDADNWLISPLGTRVARIEDGALQLYDKHAKTSFPLTIQDLKALTGRNECGSDENKENTV